MSKPRVIKDYHKLPESVLEQIKLVYPKGFTQHLVSFTTKDGEHKLGLPFETDDYYYLIKMSASTAEFLIEDDDDFDDDGILRDEIRASYQGKHEGNDFLDANANADNEYGAEMEDMDNIDDIDDIEDREGGINDDNFTV